MKRVLLFAALLAWSGMSCAVVYKWTDAQGKLQYGDLPPDGVKAEVVEGLGSHSSTSRAAAPVHSDAPPPKVAANNSPAGEDAAKKAVADDVAQTRDKQCAEAQDRYKKLIEGRRLYKTGADGEKQFMNSQEIDTERLNAKQDIDTICNSTT